MNPSFNQMDKMVLLNDISNIIMGQSPESSTYNEEGKGLPFYQGKAEFGENYPAPVKWCSKPSKIAEKADVLISVRAPVGPTNICQERSCIGRGLAAIRPLGGIPSEYIRYWLSTRQHELEVKSTGTTFKAISGDVLRNLGINLPSLPEQKRIVAKIESLFSRLNSAKDSLERVRQEIKRYRQSVLKAAFEGKLLKHQNQWGFCPIERVARIISGKAFKKSEYAESGVRLFQIANVTFGKTSWHEIVYLPQKYISKYVNLNLKTGDLVLALNRPLLGDDLKIAILTDEDVPAILYQRVGKFEFFDNQNRDWLFYYLQSPDFINWLKKELKGVNIPFINQTKVLKHVIPLPDYKEQSQIIAIMKSRFDQIKMLEDAVEQGLAKIEQLKQSILKKAFEGKLVDSDPNDESAEILLERINKEKSKIG